MFGIATLFKPTVPYSSFSSALYDRYIAPAIQKQNQRLFDEVFMINELANGSKVLDVGCGSGSLLHDMQLRNPTLELTGIDLSQDQLRRARARTQGLPKPIRFFKESAENLSFEDGSFDFIVSVGVLKHIGDKRRALEECARVLKPGGKMIIIEVDREGSEDRIQQFVNDTAFPAPVKKIWYRLFKKHVVGKSMNRPEATALSAGLALDRIRVDLTPKVPAFMIVGKKNV